jgi:hypothetical protein
LEEVVLIAKGHPCLALIGGVAFSLSKKVAARAPFVMSSFSDTTLGKG